MVAVLVLASLETHIARGFTGHLLACFIPFYFRLLIHEFVQAKFARFASLNGPSAGSANCRGGGSIDHGLG